MKDAVEAREFGSRRWALKKENSSADCACSTGGDTGTKIAVKKHGDRLFTFLEVEGVGWNNNEAERGPKAERRGKEELLRE